jgi:hypothetical protein
MMSIKPRFLLDTPSSRKRRTRRQANKHSAPEPSELAHAIGEIKKKRVRLAERGGGAFAPRAPHDNNPRSRSNLVNQARFAQKKDR